MTDTANLTPWLLAFHGYNSVWQVRADTWSAIADATKRLDEASFSPKREEQLESELGAMLEFVALMEHYWAFPGAQRVERITARVADREYGLAYAAVEAIVQQLMVAPHELLHSRSDAKTVDQGDQGDQGDQRDQRELPAKREPARARRPRFEVLVVADVSRREADEVREELHRQERPEDAFVYELVFVSSFEDALVALVLNFNLQACVVRTDVPPCKGGAV